VLGGSVMIREFLCVVGLTFQEFDIFFKYTTRGNMFQTIWCYCNPYSRLWTIILCTLSFL